MALGNEVLQHLPAATSLQVGAPARICTLLEDKSPWLGLVLLCPLTVGPAALCSAPPGCGAAHLPAPRHGPIRHRATARGNKSPSQAAADIRTWRTRENLEITQLYSSQHRATHSRGETSRRQGEAASKPGCEPLPNPSSVCCSAALASPRNASVSSSSHVLPKDSFCCGRVRERNPYQ